ncbi:flagellar biosynthetic protein FliR [Massilia sp. TSP1-1-2]|uniref:flagellar biosynthetic protein FliR n=1 Tax=Massilia sp. TSP1-1-2 TaxID=2804649 RepID=UPI003CEF527F
MTITIDPAWMLSVFLVALRIGVLLMMSPVFTSLNGLVTVRVLLTLMLSTMLVSGMHLARPPVALSIGPVMLAALSELAVGATLAFGVMAAFGAFAVAGKILDVQSGFGIGAVYDPVTRAGAPLFSTMLNMVAVVVFFSMDAHHAFLRGIAFSLRQAPPGTGLGALNGAAVLAQFGLMFSLGVALIIPVMLCLLLVEMGLAIISRVLPQMNVFIVLVPVKLVAGIALFALTIMTLGPSMSKVFAAIFTFWEQVL